jgi:hypothetical protein
VAKSRAPFVKESGRVHVLLHCAWLAAASIAWAVVGASRAAASEPQSTAPARLKVFLDCTGCYADFLRTEVTFVDYVRDRTEADVHLLITRAGTGSGGTEFTLAFLGGTRFPQASETVKTVTGSSDTDDVARRQIATAVRVGLLRFVAREAIPPELAVTVRLGSDSDRTAAENDRWNNWVFSLRGSASFDGQESSRERRLSGRIGADRITPDWKITLGSEIDHQREEFDLDEDDPVNVERRERDFNWLIVKGLGQHWSIGAQGDIESSTFENTALSISGAPAVEYNLFPYSDYTRRQLRAIYSIGISRFDYYETTLFGKTRETLPQHELSVTYEQRERWGSLEARVEWSQYLRDLSKSRLEADGELSVRLARGLSVAAEVNASRIRDQLSIPARGATEEEVLLRLRRLRSNYEYSFGVSLTYTFGSIFSSIVNPRFGQ